MVYLFAMLVGIMVFGGSSVAIITSILKDKTYGFGVVLFITIPLTVILMLEVPRFLSLGADRYSIGLLECQIENDEKELQEMRVELEELKEILKHDIDKKGW